MSIASRCRGMIAGVDGPTGQCAPEVDVERRGESRMAVLLLHSISSIELGIRYQ